MSRLVEVKRCLDDAIGREKNVQVAIYVIFLLRYTKGKSAF